MEQAKIEIEQQRVALDHEKIKNDKAVSYTHLDVYKRQIQRYANQYFPFLQLFGQT